MSKVWVVLEHAKGQQDAKVHAVFQEYNKAKGLALSLIHGKRVDGKWVRKPAKGYVAVLGKTARKSKGK